MVGVKPNVQALSQQQSKMNALGKLEITYSTHQKMRVVVFPCINDLTRGCRDKVDGNKTGYVKNRSI